MVRLIKKRLEGSTLIEVLIAMVIIVVIFTIAMQVFANVMRTSISTTQIKVEHQMRAIAKEIKFKGDGQDETRILDSVRYELKITPSVSEGLSQLEISAIQGEHEIAKYRCLFMTKANDEN